MLVGAARQHLPWRGCRETGREHRSGDPSAPTRHSMARGAGNARVATFLLMAAMIVGPTLNAFVMVFALGGVSATVSVAAHFVADDALNRRLMKQGTMVGFSLVFAVAVMSLLNAGEMYGYDTGGSSPSSTVPA